MSNHCNSISISLSVARHSATVMVLICWEARRSMLSLRRCCSISSCAGGTDALKKLLKGDQNFTLPLLSENLICEVGSFSFFSCRTRVDDLALITCLLTA